MTTALLAPVDAPLTGRGLGFGRLLNVEMRKQLDTRAGRGLLIAIGVLTAAAVAAMMWFGRREGVPMGTLLMGTLTPQGMLLPVLGVVTVCNEWSQRTALVTFTHEPRRWRVLAAKALAALLLGTAMWALAFGLAAAGHAVSMAAAGNSSQIDFGITGALVLNTWLAQMLVVAQGIGFGALLMSVPLGIVAFYVVPSLWAIVAGLWGPLKRMGAWIDLAQAQAPLMSRDALTGHQWQQLLVAALLWVGLPLVLGLVRTIRREVK